MAVGLDSGLFYQATISKVEQIKHGLFKFFYLQN